MQLKASTDHSLSKTNHKWTTLKRVNLKVADYFKELGQYAKTQKIKGCGTVLRVSNDGSFKSSWLCKDPLCPLCSWRKSVRNRVQVHQLLVAESQQFPDAIYLFLTLTVKNVIGEDLDSELQTMGRAVSLMFQRRALKESTMGYIRTTEVTVNHDGPVITFHPHMHLLVMANKNYFSKQHDFYQTTEQLSNLWCQALKWQGPEKLVVNIKKIRPNKKGHDALLAAATEVGKYQVKSTDYLTNDEEVNLQVISALSKGLKGKRLISFGDEFKKTRHNLKLNQQNDQTAFNSQPIITDELNESTVEWNYRLGKYSRTQK
ncbi:protein rep [Lactiplantibacillus paraplantarum]|uniref:protein rep n=1 Tax=Lactiplantibacillus paraplantarum TaxID=60520 RepID=UPI003DA3231D